MKARTKFLTGGAVVLGTVGYLMFSSTRETGAMYLTPGELLQKRAAESDFATTRPVEVGANVVPGSWQKPTNGRDHKFRAAFGKDTLSVAYNGIVPDTFKDSVDVLMEGVLDGNGTFLASNVVTKCASRYEVAPVGPGAVKVKGSVGAGAVNAPDKTTASAGSNRT